MKKYIIGVILFFSVMSCSTDEVMEYDAPRYVQFVKDYTDTLEFSFRYYPGEKHIDVGLEVKLVGDLLTTVSELNLTVESKNYTGNSPLWKFLENPSFDVNKSRDTIYLSLIKAAMENDTKGVYMIDVDIHDNEYLLKGETEFTRKVIRISNILSRPDWWNSNVEANILGSYSELKYQTFIDNIYSGDLSGASTGELRVHAINFKNYLKQLNPPLMENGVDMSTTIPVIGS